MSSGRFSADAARAWPEEVLRAVIRERAHHILETSLQEVLLGKPPTESHGLQTVERLLQVWDERGLAASADDLAWVRKLVQWARSGPEELAFTPRYSAEEVRTIRRLIQERRSVRYWDGRPVPQEMLEDIVRAGQWALCLQSADTARAYCERSRPRGSRPL
ncbi:MAG: hypothetical protein FJ026_01680 [Chloroflexi bacterium]|nr:hypothetical protein [Chloroflexota bacterium]